MVDMPKCALCGINPPGNAIYTHTGSLSNYVPRSCGNCLYYKPLTKECIHHPTDCDKGVFQYWQPRPSEQSKETFFSCAKCHGDSLKYHQISTGQKYKGEYSCEKCFKEWEKMDLDSQKLPVHNRLTFGEWVDSVDVSKEIPHLCGNCGYNNEADICNRPRPSICHNNSMWIPKQTCGACREWVNIEYATDTAAYTGQKGRYKLHGSYVGDQFVCDGKGFVPRPPVIEKTPLEVREEELRASFKEIFPDKEPFDCRQCIHFIRVEGMKMLCDGRPDEYPNGNPINTWINSCGAYKPRPAAPAPENCDCARCGKTPIKEDYYPSTINGMLCQPCWDEYNNGKHQYFLLVWKEEETAAGRPWFIDRKCQNCDWCDYHGNNGYANCKRISGKTCQIDERCEYWILKKKPAAAPVFDNTMSERVKAIKYALENGKYDVIKTEDVIYQMFKCAQCGYEDETRKKVKYCPACGIEVEKTANAEVEHKTSKWQCYTCGKEVSKQDFKNGEIMNTRWGLLDTHNVCQKCLADAYKLIDISNPTKLDKWTIEKRNKWCGVAVEQKDGKYMKVYEDTLTENTRLNFENEDLQRAKGDLAAKYDDLAAKVQSRDMVIEDRNAEISHLEVTLDDLKQKLARKGIPWKCRKCPKVPINGTRCKFLLTSYGIRGFLGVTYCDSVERCDQLHPHKEKVIHPAKPAPLWKLKYQKQRKERQARKIQYKYEHRNDAEKIQKCLVELDGNIKYWKDNLKGSASRDV